MEDVGLNQPLWRNDFWRNKTVFITGHTGFKGAWLAYWLHHLGAKVVGYALAPATEPNLYVALDLAHTIESIIADVRDVDALRTALRQSQPDIVFHLAAQALVRESYAQPMLTWQSNVMGTVNLLEILRQGTSARVCQVITSDKCYRNNEGNQAFVESDPLGGKDPYSASKAATELVVGSYQHLIDPQIVSLASTRAGNVIGGGDWAKDRLIPDCMRAIFGDEVIVLRHPKATRPWQFVLEPLAAYLQLAEAQWADPANYHCAWNVGPDASCARNVSEVVMQVVQGMGRGRWQVYPEAAAQAPEATYLRIDSSLLQQAVAWQPTYTAETAIAQTIAWYQAFQADPSTARAQQLCDTQLRAYVSAMQVSREDNHHGLS